MNSCALVQETDFQKRLKIFLGFARGGPSSNGKSGLNLGSPSILTPQGPSCFEDPNPAIITASNPSIQGSLVILYGW